MSTGQRISPNDRKLSEILGFKDSGFRYPMINVLRTPQVKAAQRGLPTGLVYEQNEKTLSEIGEASLSKCLEARDWAAMKGCKVDRKDVDVLKRARKLMADAGLGAGDDLAKTGADAERASAAANAGAHAPNAAAAAPNAAPNAAAAPNAVAAPAPAYASWASAVDPSSGATYYYDTATGETSWTWPPHS